ncbi:MAG: N-formylglutamate amidohydrolase [Prolixibacteraceae bacterium]
MIRIEYDIRQNKSPFLATAIHNGHDVDEEVEKYFVIDEFARLREEDPFTGFLAKISQNYMIVHTSRFQTDLNRSREGALYRNPEQAWGLDVWKADTPVSLLNQLLNHYDHFYKQLGLFLKGLIQSSGYLIIYDFHSYNYMRIDGVKADPAQNPEINVGTGSLNRNLWGPVVESFCDALRRFDYFGRKLDVRENIKFRGGYLSRWIHEHFPDRTCVLAIELKKFFMDEWNGAVDVLQLYELRKAFLSTLPAILRQAERIGKERFPAFSGEKLNPSEGTGLNK